MSYLVRLNSQNSEKSQSGLIGIAEEPLKSRFDRKFSMIKIIASKFVYDFDELLIL